MSDLQFPEHTEEKLESLKFYYNIWFDIVKRQKTYVIDTFAGTGYSIIRELNKKNLGSALLAIDLFKKDKFDNLKIILFEIDENKCNLLENNVADYISNTNIKAKIGETVIIHNCDWSTKLKDILNSTDDGIRLFCLDAENIKSLPWKTFLPLLQRGKSVFGYKESGIEILQNWAWHTIRRKLGKYFKYKIYKELNPDFVDKRTESDLKNLEKFFGPIDWRKIADKYPNNIFLVKNADMITKLRDELIIEYALRFFEYFKYVRIHTVYTRKITKNKGVKERGKVKYFLIFATNYREAAEKIIDVKFKEYRKKKVYIKLPEKQKSLFDFIKNNTEYEKPQKIKSIKFPREMKNLERELGTELFKKTKQIISFLYRHKNQDYGCFDFVLFNEFDIDKHDSSIKFLINSKIIGIRDREAKSRKYLGLYYYLIHPSLVDRQEYLFYDDKVYVNENGKLNEVN